MFYALQDKLSRLYTGPTMFCQANVCTICFIVISNVFDFSSFGYLRQLHAQ